jgi:anti-sigma B factor antagonist
MTDDLHQELETDLAREDGQATLRVAGEIDLHNVDDLRRAMEEATTAAPRLVVDLTRVGFMDSSGLRLLLETRRTLDVPDRSMALVLAPGGVVERLLQLANVLTMFERAQPPADA